MSLQLFLSFSSLHACLDVEGNVGISAFPFSFFNDKGASLAHFGSNEVTVPLNIITFVGICFTFVAASFEVCSKSTALRALCRYKRNKEFSRRVAIYGEPCSLRTLTSFREVCSSKPSIIGRDNVTLTAWYTKPSVLVAYDDLLSTSQKVRINNHLTERHNNELVYCF